MNFLNKLIERALFLVALLGALYQLFLVIHPFTPLYNVRINILTNILTLEQLQKGTHVLFILIVGYLLTYLRGQEIKSIGIRWIIMILVSILTLIPTYLVLQTFKDLVHLQILTAMIWFLSLLIPVIRPLVRNFMIAYTDIFLALISISFYVYLVLNFEAFVARATAPTPEDVFMGYLTLLLVMGLVIRLVGPELPLLVALFLLYTLYGYLLPKPWAFPGVDIDFLMAKIFVEPEAALFGIITRVSLLYVVYFTILVGVLTSLGYGDAMARFAKTLLGKKPATVGRAVVALGAVMGMVSGSGAADTAYIASTFKDSFRAVGYDDLVAAGLAANAGTLAYITPPILGSVAFLIVELLGIPYSWVIIMSAGPALLYALSILLYNEFYVRVNKIGFTSKEIKEHKSEHSEYFEEITKNTKSIIGFLPPVIILTLIFLGYTVRMAVTIAIGFAIVIASLIKEMRSNLRKIFGGLAEGFRLVTSVGASIVLANVLMSVVVITGLPEKFSAVLLTLIGNNLILAILFAFFFSLLLGMGVPPLATYILSSLLTAPTLVNLAVSAGVPEEAALLATHMFLFYVSMLADITPPVGLSNFAAAAVYGLDSIKVGVRASVVAIAKFIYAMSFLWSYWGSALLILPITLTSNDILQSIYLISTRFLAVVGGILFLSIANAGGIDSDHRLGVIPRLLLMIAGILLIIPDYTTNISGFLLGITLLAISYKLKPKR